MKSMKDQLQKLLPNHPEPLTDAEEAEATRLEFIEYINEINEKTELSIAEAVLLDSTCYMIDRN